MRLGLIGLRAIGKAVLADVDRGAAPGVTVAAMLTRRPRLDEERATTDPQQFFATGLDAVLECAGHEAVRAHGERALHAGADLLVTSAGALADEVLTERLRAAAVRNERRVRVPSAGIGALDILAAAAVGGLARVDIVVRKDILSWRGTAAEATHDLARLIAATVLYDGPVREGARLYPQNVNIAAAAALAGIGLDRTRLTIVADPALARHVVEIHAEGAFGRFDFTEDVVPSDNPKTGRLVTMALVKTVRQLAAPLVVGG
jgi:aspartate dehydrogenase